MNDELKAAHFSDSSAILERLARHAPAEFGALPSILDSGELFALRYELPGGPPWYVYTGPGNSEAGFATFTAYLLRAADARGWRPTLVKKRNGEWEAALFVTRRPSAAVVRSHLSLALALADAFGELARVMTGRTR